MNRVVVLSVPRARRRRSRAQQADRLAIVSLAARAERYSRSGGPQQPQAGRGRCTAWRSAPDSIVPQPPGRRGAGDGRSAPPRARGRQWVLCATYAEAAGAAARGGGGSHSSRAAHAAGQRVRLRVGRGHRCRSRPGARTPHSPRSQRRAQWKSDRAATCAALVRTVVPWAAPSCGSFWH